MSDRPTPMTDDAVEIIYDHREEAWRYLVPADFARTLERQLAEAKEAIQAARKLLHEARRDHSAGMSLAAYERIQEAINHLTP